MNGWKGEEPKAPWEGETVAWLPRQVCPGESDPGRLSAIWVAGRAPGQLQLPGFLLWSSSLSPLTSGGDDAAELSHLCRSRASLMVGFVCQRPPLLKQGTLSLCGVQVLMREGVPTALLWESSL